MLFRSVEVVPCALVGTHTVLPINTFHVHPGPVQLVFGEPIPTAGLTLHDMNALSERVKRSIEALNASANGTKPELSSEPAPTPSIGVG